MTNNNNESGNNAWMAYFSGLAILFAIAAGYSIYIFFLGNPANFEDGDVAKGHPLGLLGIIYRGGIAIVPLLIAVNITVILVSIERFITLSAAQVVEMQLHLYTKCVQCWSKTIWMMRLLLVINSVVLWPMWFVLV